MHLSYIFTASKNLQCVINHIIIQRHKEGVSINRPIKPHIYFNLSSSFDPLRSPVESPLCDPIFSYVFSLNDKIHFLFVKNQKGDSTK